MDTVGPLTQAKRAYEAALAAMAQHQTHYPHTNDGLALVAWETMRQHLTSQCEASARAWRTLAEEATTALHGMVVERVKARQETPGDHRRQAEAAEATLTRLVGPVPEGQTLVQAVRDATQPPEGGDAGEC